MGTSSASVGTETCCFCGTAVGESGREVEVRLRRKNSAGGWDTTAAKDPRCGGCKAMHSRAETVFIIGLAIGGSILPLLFGYVLMVEPSFRRDVMEQLTSFRLRGFFLFLMMTLLAGAGLGFILYKLLEKVNLGKGVRPLSGKRDHGRAIAALLEQGWEVGEPPAKT